MPNPTQDRPKSLETENEDLRPKEPGPPRPATEPEDAEASVKQAKTATDPGSGEAPNGSDPKNTARPKAP